MRSPAARSGRSSASRRGRRATTRSRAASAARSSARRCSGCRAWCSSRAAACRGRGAKLAAAAISPSTGFNRLVFADRYGGVFSSHDAPYYSRARLGYAHNVREETGIATDEFRRNEAQIDFSLDYGVARQARLRVHAAVRLLQLPGDGLERERPRERAHARPAGRQVVRGGPVVPRRLGHLRQLRLHLAADLPRLDDRASRSAPTAPGG